MVSDIKKALQRRYAEQYGYLNCASGHFLVCQNLCKGQFPLGEFIRAKRKAARLFSKRKSLFNFHYTAKSFGAFFIYHLKKKKKVGRWLEFLIVKNC